MNYYQVKKINPKQLGLCCKLVRDVISEMRIEGIEQWDEQYPTKSDLSNDIISGHAFGCFLENKAVAYIALNEEADPQYEEANWIFPDEGPLIIHRISVDPEFRKKGIGKFMVSFAENWAIENGYKVIRLDAFSCNPAALGMYDKAGYRRAGSAIFRKGLFYLYEKRLIPS